MAASLSGKLKPGKLKPGKLNRRYVTIAIVGLVLLIVLGIAPTYNRVQSGSTWSNAPDGYGAWYEYMQQQGAGVERWGRSLDALIDRLEQNSEENGTDKPATLLRIIPPALGIEQWSSSAAISNWIAAGNHLIVLSQQRPALATQFKTLISSDEGAVTIETRRRANNADPGFNDEISPMLSDSFGAVVWQQAFPASEKRDRTDHFIQSTTPFIAANAYLNEPGNFAFLAAIAQAAGGPIFIDEYLHGYKDSDVVIEEVAGTWFGYLAQTPLLVVVLQGVVILLIALVAQNKRMGLMRSLSPKQINNSEAYITALAGVLNKANSENFLIETLSKSEQKALQRSLGLGDAPVPLETLKTAWQQTTGQSPAELNILKARPRGKTALQQWLGRIQQLPIKASQPKS